MQGLEQQTRMQYTWNFVNQQETTAIHALSSLPESLLTFFQGHAQEEQAIASQQRAFSANSTSWKSLKRNKEPETIDFFFFSLRLLTKSPVLGVLVIKI